MKQHISIIIVLVLTFNLTRAQDYSQEIENDIKKFSTLLNNNSDSAHYYIERAYKKSIRIKNESLSARTSYNLGYYYYLKNNIQYSKKYLFQALKFSKETNYSKISSLIYNQLGTIAADKDQFEEALRLYINALEIAKKNKLPENKSRILINMGNLYLRQKDTVNSLNCYNENILNAKQFSLNQELITGYLNIAIVYSEKDFKKAINYYSKALLIAQKNKILYSEYSIHISICDLYLKNDNKKGLEKVYYHLQEAKKIQSVLKDETLLFYLYFNYGGYYRYKNQNTEALMYYNKSLELSKKNIVSDQILNLYSAISDTYFNDKDYKSAILYKDKYHKLSDSIFTIEQKKIFKEIQTKYEVDKKNLKIQILTKEKIIEKNKKNLMMFVGFILVILLLISILFYSNRIKTQKIIVEKEDKIHKQEIYRLEQEKEIKRIIGLVQGQDQERNRVAKEIHDGVSGDLAGIKLQLFQINSILKNESIKSIILHITKVFDELRNISHDLSLNYILERSLESLLIEQKNEYEKRLEFKVELVVFPYNGLEGLSVNMKHQLYRIIKELLLNISKHANAKNVLLSFTKQEESLNIVVEDDGRGFGDNKFKGIGLKNIEERLTTINGLMTIDSIQKEGTTIVIDIPNLKLEK